MINIPPFWLSYESMVVSPELNIFTQNNNNHKVTVSAPIFCMSYVYFLGHRPEEAIVFFPIKGFDSAPCYTVSNYLSAA